MTLEEFTTALEKRVQSFKDHYLEQHKQEQQRDPHGKQWSLEMDEEEWFEQFLAFMESGLHDTE